METEKKPIAWISEVDSEPSFATELRAFLAENRKWWLLPLFVSFFVVAALLALSSSVAAPFIYTLF